MTLVQDEAAPDRVTQEAVRRDQIRVRDRSADGRFFYAVTTTGVYCYPSCAARPARPEHIRIFPSRAAAEQAGFRPCKRCRPDLPPRAEREAAMVARACRAIEAAEEPPALADLARAAGVSPHHFHRLFTRIAGVTPKAYADAQRAERARAALAAGGRVTDAIYEAGFGSSGRFYAAAEGMLGMSPARYRAGGAGETIGYAIGSSSLGRVLVGATERGACAILFAADDETARAELARRFPKARLEPAGAEAAALLDRVLALIEHPGAAANLPLDIRGTAFQRRVWEALRAIPPGETRSYGEVAASLGAHRAARAVAAACAANALAVAVPCHRVIAGGGDLAGYRWGVERKRALLSRERAA
jgi:AraC family transcriptional regulator of adaptative response/methylated-DNA-[protein]-cysteine methyltransferase